ncbi:Trp biosynthesis-associated membrane protein [Arthrobacter sp. C9C5]|uniref:Trp biosynthesis-associated membrane protein n=1 Tax=Arthrobacter sp. C9C5 TaxID=2735267 RepID=UPI0015850705|nr:Trp biosynthesis-associated membrane protein [Arthrobacter sp. C9C5]NUU30934.1 Trp biosynthesis-associated membrane protein [Arthrobacter sp. C9C5]
MTGPAMVKSTSPAVPRWARKSTLVLVIAALALAVFGTTTQTWLTVQLDPSQLGQAVSSQNGLQVQGSKAATTVTALALVALAGGLAASIAGRVARWIITAIILLAAAGIVAAAATVLADPLAAAQGSIAAATGISGSNVQVALTAFPVLAVVAGSLLGLGALAIVPAGRYWKSRTKYDAAASAGASGTAQPADEIDSWDRLSRGDDPT